MNTPSEILRKHEDANEMHFHEVDRKFIIEAMEEYAKEKSEKPINISSQQTAVDWYFDKIKSHFEHDGDLFETACFTYAIAKQKEKEQHKDTYVAAMARPVVMDINPFEQAEQYFNQTYNKNKQ